MWDHDKREGTELIGLMGMNGPNWSFTGSILTLKKYSFIKVAILSFLTTKISNHLIFRIEVTFRIKYSNIIWFHETFKT